MKAIAYLRAHPVMALLIVAGIAAIVALLVLPQRSAPVATTPLTPAPTARPATPAAASPTPAPAAAPSPAAAPAPGAESPARTPTAAPAPGVAQRPGAAVDAGRADPFAPLVRAGSPGGGGGGLPPIPPAPLPPPLFPGQQPSQPGPGPAVAPREASGAALVGIIGDGAPGVAIIRIGKDTFIVSPGDVIRDRIRVEVIDISKRVVILEQEGERFELKMGGVSGPHVAAAASSHFN